MVEFGDHIQRPQSVAVLCGLEQIGLECESRDFKPIQNIMGIGDKRFYHTSV